MIDLHNHILPGLDDGAANLDESVAISRQFVEEGVVRIAATPHVNPEERLNLGHALQLEKLEELRQALQSALIHLSVVSGCELYLTPEAADLLQAGMALPLGDSRAVLTELSLFASQAPLYFEDSLFRLQLAGYQPLIAHPERYPFVQRRIQALDEIINRGVILQLTAPSLLGHYGARVRHTAERLLRRGSYAVAASDRHHPDQDRSLRALHARIAALTTEDVADLLLRINPARLLAGEPVIRPETHDEVKVGLLDWLFRK